MPEEIRGRQCGAITRRQALACGITRAGIEARVTSGRWQRILPRVYATFSGPAPRDCLLWAVVLWAGDGAVLSHETAAELVGLSDAPSGPAQPGPAPVHVTIPAQLRRARLRGVVVHHTHQRRTPRRSGQRPPHTGVEETVVDLTQTARTLDQALGWVARACGRRLTTPPRLANAIEGRPRLRWRPELRAALGDVAAGCHSLLELRYLRAVERAHRLPTGRRQYRTAANNRRRYDDVRYDDVRYDDVRYERYGVVVELDGRAAHADDARWRDARRDNGTVLAGARVLRYGWGDVAHRPCLVATQVGAVLRAAGWPGAPRPCGPGCTADNG